MEIASLVVSCIVALWAIVSSVIVYSQNKTLEKLKSQLDSFSHMTKTQFDFEFEIYKTLSHELGKMIESTSALYPSGIYYESQDENEKINERTTKYHKSIDDYNSFQQKLNENQPFMDEGIYNSFCEIHKLCHDQICLYWDFMITKNDTMRNECVKELNECWRRTPAILEKKTEINKQLRAYLKKQKIISETR